MLQLNYKRVLSNGKEVGVYNEKVSNGIIDKYVGPFDTLEECKEYCDNYTDSYRMGYNGRARDRKSTRLNSSHSAKSRMPSSA